MALTRLPDIALVECWCGSTRTVTMWLALLPELFTDVVWVPLVSNSNVGVVPSPIQDKVGAVAEVRGSRGRTSLDVDACFRGVEDCGRRR